MKNVTKLEEVEVQTRHGFSDTHTIVNVYYIDDKGRNTMSELNLNDKMDEELYNCYKLMLKFKNK